MKIRKIIADVTIPSGSYRRTGNLIDWYDNGYKELFRGYPELVTYVGGTAVIQDFQHIIDDVVSKNKVLRKNKKLLQRAAEGAILTSYETYTLYRIRQIGSRFEMVLYPDYKGFKSLFERMCEVYPYTLDTLFDDGEVEEDVGKNTYRSLVRALKLPF